MIITSINIFVVINQTNKHKAKIYNHCTYTQIIIKKNYFFSWQCIRISGNRINFANEKILKSEFYNKIKKIFNVDDIDVNKILVSKKNDMVNIIHLNTLLGITITMLYLDHYI